MARNVVQEFLTAWGFEVDMAAVRQFNRALDDARKKTDGVSLGLKRFSEAGASFRTFRDRIAGIAGALTKFVALPALGAGAAMIKLSADAEESQSKFEAIFKDLAAPTQAWADQFAAAAGRSKTELRKLLGDVGAFTNGVGFAGEQSAELARKVTELAVDLSSFHNISEEDALLKLQSGLAGETEAVRRLGADIRVEAVEEELARQGVTGVITEQQKVLARMAIIMRSTSDAQGDAIRTAGSFTNQMRALRGEVIDMAVQLGGQLLPVIKPFVTAVKDWVVANRQVLAQRFSSFLSGLASGLVQVWGWITSVARVVGGLVDFLGGLEGVANLAGAALAFMTAQMAVGTVLEFVQAIRTLKATYQGLAIAAALANLTIAALPMLIAVAIGLIFLFRKEIMGLWEEAVDVVEGAIASTAEFFGAKPLPKMGMVERPTGGGAGEPAGSLAEQVGFAQLLQQQAAAQAASVGAGAPPAAPAGSAAPRSVVNVNSPVNVTVTGAAANSPRESAAEMERAAKRVQDRAIRQALHNMGGR